MKNVLIVYATKTNTTKEYAEYIKSKLKTGHKVDVLPLESAHSLSEYDVVVIGAPINGMMWRKDATEFVIMNADILKTKQLFYFFVSYMYEHARPMWVKAIYSSMLKVSKLVEPIYVGKLPGRIEKPMPKLINFMFGIKKNTPTNLVDFNKTNELIEKINSML